MVDGKDLRDMSQDEMRAALDKVYVSPRELRMCRLSPSLCRMVEEPWAEIQRILDGRNV